MAADQIMAALDIGTTKIACVVGERDAHGDLYVIGHGVAPAEGLKRGVVIDMDKTARAIKAAVHDAQLVSGTEIDRVTVGITGEHIRSINSNGVVGVSRSDHEVTAVDVRKAIDAARSVPIPVDREVIHVIPQCYSLDDQSDLLDPVGMHGVRLEVDAHIVTASVTSARNIFRTLERCRLDIDHLVLEALAMAPVILSNDDMSHGCVLVDIGGEMTTISLFVQGAVRHTAVVPIGGKQVTNDIAIGLKTTVEQAETLKRTHGCALASLVDPAESISVPSITSSGPRDLSRHLLASIIEPRVEEILSLVARELKKVISPDALPGGMILVGGGSLLAGTVELTEHLYSLPARRGAVSGFEHIPDAVNSVSYATALGLLLFGFSNEPISQRPSGVKGMLRRFEQWIGKQF